METVTPFMVDMARRYFELFNSIVKIQTYLGIWQILIVLCEHLEVAQCIWNILNDSEIV